MIPTTAITVQFLPLADFWLPVPASQPLVLSSLEPPRQSQNRPWSTSSFRANSARTAETNWLPVRGGAPVRSVIAVKRRGDGRGAWRCCSSCRVSSSVGCSSVDCLRQHFRGRGPSPPSTPLRNRVRRRRAPLKSPPTRNGSSAGPWRGKERRAEGSSGGARDVRNTGGASGTGPILTW